MMKRVGCPFVGTEPVWSAPGWLRQVSGVAVGVGRGGRGVAVNVGTGEAVGVGGSGSEGRQADSVKRRVRVAKINFA